MEKILKSIIFVDIREFTRACDKSFIVLSINDFLEEFYSIIEELFKDSHIKYMGDGALILSNSPDIVDLLKRCYQLVNKFQKLCQDFSEEKGVQLILGLGFGITKGDVIEIRRTVKGYGIIMIDYISPKINLGSRLCSLSKPYGIIIHQESFPKLNNEFEDKFNLVVLENIRGLESHPELRCFIEKSIKLPESVPKVQPINVETHVTGLCYQNRRVLLCKRSPERDIEATKWAGPGGKIAQGESFEASLRAAFRKEVGIEIDNIKLLNTYFIETHRIPGIIYYCEIAKGSPYVADSKQNSEIKFFSENELEGVESSLLPSKLDLKKGFEWARESKKLSTRLRIIISQKCNLNCKFCHGENVFENYSTNTKEIKNSINIINKYMNLTTVVISGGEPFIEENVNNVFEICTFLKETNPSIFPIYIVTNGLTLNSQILNLVKNNDVSLKLSIYGEDDNSFYDYTGFEFRNYFDHILSVLKEANKLDVNYSLNILLNKYINDRIPSIIEKLNDKDIHPKKIKIIEMVQPKKENQELSRDFVKFENSLCYEDDFAHKISDRFPQRVGTSFRGQNIEFYRYPCYDPDQCNICLEKWGIIILPDGSIQYCENILMNENISINLRKLNIPLHKYDLSSRLLKF